MTYLVVAYSIVWLIMFGYIYSLGKKQTKLLKEIEFLKEMENEH
ncbi:CcmD family protein [Mesobacillus zeae]|uniref:CcmD family protein n=1 Tax=Mesobacillus zeae TaxID=1917180 RepID=A0A398B4Z9_9BACI|nr:CcmD family protein [Mesobacillus zeae]RID83898.1 CcmD family protein [Mesobacillus zeae]